MANAKVVPQCNQALYDLKYEIAAQLGLPVQKPTTNLQVNEEFAGELGYIANTPTMQKDYWGHLTARDAGAVGGLITAQLVQSAQLMEVNMSMNNN
ncbi:alpha/beta-type small acid-soluble spore protein [Longirhabdus pacifica]|uniref:alpha/beta-type small acid-soluble spore protein n=1 Tax=Longirhabdus pacifica TaxID=2305227 RepID=UPI00100936FB|nr:alpha/beta-type small acid-soluble spore protein [Longirhabdus pacifica]